jgi:hypothetical protein
MPKSFRSCTCVWCPKTFRPPTSSGIPKRFCSGRCRLDFHRALSKWAIEALDAKLITIEMIKNK